MPRLLPRHRVAAGYASALLVLLVGVLAYRGATHTVAAYHDVRSRHRLLDVVHHVGDQLRDAETGQRGYLLTGRISYLDPYYRAVRAVPDSMAALRVASAAYPQYIPRVDSLSYYIRLKLGELEETIVLRQHDGSKAAQEVVRTDRGQTAMERIRQLLTALDRDIETELSREQASAHEDQQLVLGVMLAVALLAAGLALFTNVLHTRQAREQSRTYEELERQSYELQLQAAELEAANAELELTTREMVEQTVEAEVSQLRLAGILGSATDAIVAFDDDQNVVYFNAAAEHLLGVPAEEAIGVQVTRFVAPRSHAELEQRLTDVRRLGQRPAGVASASEIVAMHMDGGEVPVEASLSYARAGKQGLYTMILRDMRSQRELEEQFRQAQKMEAVGRLAGGIAHDFNNLLTVIGASSDFILQDLHKDDVELRRDVAEIRRASDRAAGLTRQLLAFSRRQLMQPQLLDLNTVVEEMQTMLRRLIGEDITLHTDFDADLGAVRLDRGQVEQVVVNLVVNARDAMPNGGRLEIATRNAPAGAEATLVTNVAEASAGFIMLSVRDTGIGMSEETKGKIFEPFFTTKEQGKGTGLGLSTVYGIVKQYGGDITVHSADGDGTEFRLYFPRTEANEDDVVEPAPAAEALRGSETVLIVEDEEPLRRLARRILESRGYDVLDAGNGHEAIDVMSARGDEVDLLLTDVVMPSMGGRELVERLLPVYPSLRVLFMSGYTEDMMLQHRIAELGITVLEKPFTPEILARAVRHTLDRVHEKERERVRS